MKAILGIKSIKYFNKKTIYKLSYIIGSKIIRKTRRIKKRIITISKKLTFSAKKNTFYAINKANEKITYSIKDKKRKFKEIKENYHMLSGKEKYTYSLKHFFVFSKSMFNYIAPIFCFFILLSCFKHFDAKTWAIQVEYNDTVIGVINSEKDYISAQRDVESRIVSDDYIVPDKPGTDFTLVCVEPAQIMDSFSLSNQIIKASGNEIESASGLYVDGEFLGAVKDSNMLLDEMDNMLEPFREINPDAKVTFANKIELKEGLYPVSGIVDTAKIARTISSEIEGETVYTVEEGDSAWAISSKTNTPLQQLLSLNPSINKRLMPGEEVVISQAKSYLDVKITKKETYSQPIAYDTEKVSDNNALKGFSAIVEPGEKGEKQITAEVTYINGKAISSTVISEEVVKEPKTQVVSYGTNVLSSSSSNTTALIWPVYGGKYLISCGWYGYYGHKAIDMASSYGTPIMAAASGTVVAALNTYTGYGRYIIIDHGSGVQTLYAHNSQLLVKAGDYVEQGQIIAKMGSTGNSSGNHCHFEVRINGRYVNPINYLP